MSRFDDENAKDIRPGINVSVTISDTSLPYSIRSYDTTAVVRLELNLRSDLSPINPTLPESEMLLEAAQPKDVSAVVSQIPMGTNVIVRFNYSGPYHGSKARYFFIDEQVTWSGGILRIHAVDQVNKLDGTIPALYLGQVWDAISYSSNPSISLYGGLGYLASAMIDLIRGNANTPIIGSTKERIYPITTSGISIMDTRLVSGQDGYYMTYDEMPEGGCVNSIIPSATRREMIAQLMNLCHQDFPQGFLCTDYLDLDDSFWPTYVDAGYPTFSVKKPTSKYTIYEEDCGDVINNAERNVSQYKFRVAEIATGYEDWLQKLNGATAKVYKQKGAAFEYSGYFSTVQAALVINGPTAWGAFEITGPDENQYVERARPYDPSYWDTSDHNALRNHYYGMWLLDDSFKESDWYISKYSFQDLSGANWTSGPEGFSPAEIWADWVEYGGVSASAQEASVDCTGRFFITTNEKDIIINTGKNGEVVEINDIAWIGHVIAKSWYSDNAVKMLPDQGLRAITKRSKKTGSFTWKGHPDMQPRDVFTYVYKEDALLTKDAVQLTNESGEDIVIGGNSEERTVESITLTYEKGGLIAEITWRAGIC